MKPTPRAGSIGSKTNGRLLVFILAALVLGVSALSAANVALRWNRNPEPDLAGYVVTWGTANTNGTPASTNHASTTGTNLVISNLAVGGYYYFFCQASNLAGLTSGPSTVILSSILSPVQGLNLSPSP